MDLKHYGQTENIFLILIQMPLAAQTKKNKIIESITLYIENRD
jgi:5,10-methylene-tetrahydrofolate dehydrogenase/methenyl tetrahydrofolate cyclohydrolase